MNANALDFLLDGPPPTVAPVLLTRERGAWTKTASELRDEVRGLAAALCTYGLGDGVRAAVLGAEGAGTLRAALAVIAGGGALVPLDPALSDDALRRALISSGAVLAIASDEDQLSRVIRLRPELPALELVLLASAAPSERKPAAMLVETAIEVGLGALAEDPGLLRRAALRSPEGPACVLADSSGETHPIPWSSLLAVAQSFGTTLEFGIGKTVFAALPVASAERLGVSLAALSRGATLLLPDTAERLDAGLDQYPPDVVLLDAAGVQRLFRSWEADIAGKSWIGRGVTRWAVSAGRQTEHGGWKHRLAENLALRKLRGKLGGRATTLDVIALDRGPAAHSEAAAFFVSVGLSLRTAPTGPAGTLAQ
jgi:long-chain acyl-CoA synthetase